MAKKQQSYEEAMVRLEHLVAQMEANELTIDQLGEALKEAQDLVKQCKAKLYQADEQIKKLLKEEENEAKSW